MKRVLFIGLLLVCANILVLGHEYTSSSVLASGNFVKIKVAETGVYKISYETLESWGLKPANVGVYGFGGAMLVQSFAQPKIDDLPSVPIYIEKGSDGVFGKGDFILFYAQGAVSWSYSGTRFSHTQNPYSDYGYYFLSDKAGAQKLFTPAEALSNANAYNVSTYTNYQVHERDLRNLLDVSKGKDGGGREFYGEVMTKDSTSVTVPFNFPNISSSTVIVKADVAVKASVSTNFKLSLGSSSNTFSITVSSANNYKMADTDGSPVTKTFNAQSGNIQNVKIQLMTSDASTTGYLNYLEAQTSCSLNLTNGYLTFRNTDHYKSTTNSVFNLKTNSAYTQVWNVTDLANIYQMPTEYSGSVMTFVGANASLQQFVAVNPNANGFLEPTFVGKVENQNLHQLKNIDLVIITPEQFLTSAQKLAAAHEEIDHLSTAVVTDQQVYNEFSSGTPDATAYRWIMKMLYDRANAGQSSAPGYLLLMGDGSFDNRKHLATSAPNTLLTFQAVNSTNEVFAYATDDYFGFLDNSEGVTLVADRMDIGVGRFPVNTSEEAENVVNKTIRYMHNENLGGWKNQVVFLADDGDNGMHTKSSDMAAEKVRCAHPDLIVNKLFIDAFQQESSASGESYPLAKSRLDNLLHNGVLLFDYVGHSGYNNIASESMLTAREIREMTNANLGFWMMASCSFSQFDATATSAGEYAILNPNGGAIGVLAACRTVYANQNEIINNHICDTLFARDKDNNFLRMGDVVRIAKNKTGNDENKLPYIFLGDPAVRLNYPNQYQVITTSQLDTIHALSTNTIEGEIHTPEGQLADWFNGKMQVTIFDKLQELKTLDNDHVDVSDKIILKYNDYPNTLFNGEINVTDGRFSHTFMTPIDIKYNYGNGKIVYYAYDNETLEEATGYYDQFLVGGSSQSVFDDNEGPNLQVYLNNPAFLNGGQTNENPHFFADIYDENGINTVGSGIGHDLLLVVDNDPKQTYVLNDYYTANGSYQSGQVSYKLTDLKEGKHELFFRAWDMLNNSSSENLQFEVVKGLNPEIFSVTTYPNPAKVSGAINMIIDHNQPDEVLQVDIYVYDMSGKMAWHQTEKGTGNRYITWKISDTVMHAGLYIYKVQISTLTSIYTSKSGKIIVLND